MSQQAASTDARESPRDRAVHLGALTLQKLADALIDPKLVLPSMLVSLGAPSWIIGALVPVREAGALLPQLALARRIARARLRKRVWAIGAAIQGAAALAMAAAGASLGGLGAGLAILAALAVLALARAAGSLAHKDALARTVPKGRRGHVTGLAASAGAAVAFAVAALLASGVISLTVTTLCWMLAAAGAALIAAAAVFQTLGEAPSEPEQDAARGGLRALIAPLREDRQLRLFIAARSALAATAFAPPFIVLLSAAEGRDALGQLGTLYIASTLAAVIASWLWGRLSDRSSRLALALSGGAAALVLTIAGAAGLAFGGLGGAMGAALAVFAAQCAYQGVRMARKLHLTDMTDDATRAPYTALANTALGAVLLAGGVFGAIAALTGPALVLVLLGMLSAIGAVLSLRLDQVQ
ncbi:MAG: MFS transporter [Paracoccus sp. (in: a-proteobacteria)]|nr:MFS transporter [Paracoccus sp. (in: a-proteobacteria)]